MKKKEAMKLDLLLVIFFPIIATLLSLSLKTNLFVSTLLFFGLPAVYLSYRKPELIKKTSIFSLLGGIPMILIIDFFAIADNSWGTPTTIFPFRFFDLIALEDFIWGILFVYAVIIFYEYFLDKGKDKIIEKNMKYVVLIFFTLTAITLFIFFKNPILLKVPYAYLWIGIILVFIPIVIFLLYFPKLLLKFLKTSFYFIYLSLLFELVAVYLNQWIFPGTNFIGWVNVMGIRFPFEELVFWIILGAAWILTYYEFFDDDRK